jgi:hypothetical protein
MHQEGPPPLAIGGEPLSVDITRESRLPHGKGRARLAVRCRIVEPPSLGDIVDLRRFRHNLNWTTKHDGTGLVQLTADTDNDPLPAWSPDCHRIAFISLRDGGPAAYLIDIPDPGDGGGLVECAAAVVDPRWAADFLSRR